MTIVWTYRAHKPRPWCVLRSAIPGERVTTLCCDAEDYAPQEITTQDPGLLACGQCRRELAAGTPGAAHAVEPVSVARTQTVDLRPARRCVDPVSAWGVPEVALDDLISRGNR